MTESLMNGVGLSSPGNSVPEADRECTLAGSCAGRNASGDCTHCGLNIGSPVTSSLSLVESEQVYRSLHAMAVLPPTVVAMNRHEGEGRDDNVYIAGTGVGSSSFAHLVSPMTMSYQSSKRLLPRLMHDRHLRYNSMLLEAFGSTESDFETLQSLLPSGIGA